MKPEQIKRIDYARSVIQEQLAKLGFGIFNLRDEQEADTIAWHRRTMLAEVQVMQRQLGFIEEALKED